MCLLVKVTAETTVARTVSKTRLGMHVECDLRTLHQKTERSFRAGRSNYQMPPGNREEVPNLPALRCNFCQLPASLIRFSLTPTWPWSPRRSRGRRLDRSAGLRLQNQCHTSSRITYMHHTTDHRTIGGEAVHVGDCFIWAQIHYLDSPTDYREYIVSVAPTRGAADDFITLDDSEGFPWRAVVRFFTRLRTTLSTLRWKSQRATTA